MKHCCCQSGRIEVVTGPMCSGKTEEVIRRLHREVIAGREPFIFVPDRGRYQGEIQTRLGAKMTATVVKEAGDVRQDEALVRELQELGERACDGDYLVIAFDEAQWMEGVAEVAEWLAGLGCRVLISGLDVDYLGKPFPSMGEAMCVAEKVSKLTAVSLGCRGLATRTARLGDGEDEGGDWAPLCRRKWAELHQR